MHRLRTRAAIAGAFAAAVALTAGVALGTTLVASEYTDAEGRYHACVQRENGNVRIVVPGAACRETESAIDWNQRGPQGPPGPAGAQGAPGPQGPPGADGAGLTTVDQLNGLTCKIGANDGTIVLQDSILMGGAAAAYSMFCLRPDEFEPNNERASAADITSRVATMPFPGGNDFLNFSATLFPTGDEDWYVVHDRTFRSIMAPFGARLDIYRDGELVAENLQIYPPNVFPPPTPGSFFNDLAGPHDWLFRVKPLGPKPASYFFSIF